MQIHCDKTMGLKISVKVAKYYDGKDRYKCTKLNGAKL